MRCFERWLRRARVALSMTEGFHPKPRMNFLAPLALGIEGLDEVLECDLAEVPTAEGLSRRLAEHAPPGWRLGAVDVLPEGSRRGRAVAFQYRVELPEPPCPGLAERVERLLGADACEVSRDRNRKPLDIRPRIDWIRLDGRELSMRLLVAEGGEASPRHVLSALGLDEPTATPIQRTAVEIDPGPRPGVADRAAADRPLAGRPPA